MKTNIELAEEAEIWLSGPDDTHCLYLKGLDRFAELVRQDQREIDAKVCDTEYYQNIGPMYGEVRLGIAKCAAAIRKGRE